MNSIFEAAPRLGMGCWAIGGPFWNGDVPVGYSGTDDQESIRTVHASWAAGVRVFDTSAVYGAGHSETLLGEALHDRSDAIIVSKLGHSFNAETKQMTGPRFDPDYVRHSVSESRERLRRDRIDVMLLHINELPLDDARSVFDTLEELRLEGQIGAFGWSTDFPERVTAMAERPGFLAVQHAMNVFFDVPTMTDVCVQNDLVQLIRSPLAMGVLTGSFSDGRKVPDQDIRSNDSNWQHYFADGRGSPEFLAKVEAVRDLLTTGGRSLAQGALCWLLAKSELTVPIPGAKTVAQAEENAASLGFDPLPSSIMQEIEGVMDRPPEGSAREL